MPSLEQTVVLRYLDAEADLALLADARRWEELLTC